MVFSQMNRLPADVTTDCVVVIDATGMEHKILLEHCRSFEQLRGFLPILLENCQPDRRHIQSGILTGDNMILCLMMALT